MFFYILNQILLDYNRSTVTSMNQTLFQLQVYDGNVVVNDCLDDMDNDDSDDEIDHLFIDDLYDRFNIDLDIVDDISSSDT